MGFVVLHLNCLIGAGTAKYLDLNQRRIHLHFPCAGCALQLLSRGPVGFVRELIAVFHEAEAAWSHHFSQRHTGTAAADGHGWEGAPSDRIEERVRRRVIQH